MRKGQTLFTYLHLAASKPCTDALLASGTTSIAYETVQTADGALPLLAPMSEVAGRLAAQVGAYHLMRTHGGRGVLMGGVPGVAPAEVVVIGGGMAGDNAAARRQGHGRPRHRVRPQHQHAAQDRRRVRRRHRDPLLVEPGSRGRGQAGRPGDRRGPGARRQGAQAGHQCDCRAHEVRVRCWSTSPSTRAAASRIPGPPPTTTRPSPVHDTVFYCVANMPGAVPRTSTYALTNATMPYVLKLADKGWQAACAADAALGQGPVHARGRAAVRAGGRRPGPAVHRSGRSWPDTLQPSPGWSWLRPGDRVFRPAAHSWQRRAAVASTMQELLSTVPSTTTEALDVFDAAEVVEPESMAGTKNGARTANRSTRWTGLLAASGWWGKQFVDAETVHPLHVPGTDGASLWALNPALGVAGGLGGCRRKLPPLRGRSMQWARSRRCAGAANPRAQAPRLRTTCYRGIDTATMAGTEANCRSTTWSGARPTTRGLGRWTSGTPLPYFFVLRRDDSLQVT